jgi:two-component system, NarL family, response regulator YdfI
VLVAASAGRSGLAARLGAVKTLAVTVAAPGVPLAEQVEDGRPDVVLLELVDPRAVDWLRDSDASAPPPAILVLADRPRSALGAEWLRTGSRAVLPSHVSTAAIVAAIEAIATGLVVLHPETVPGGKPKSSALRGAASTPLSPRELEVLGMMADGLGNKIIAARLGISLHTVKFHVASIFAKLGAESRTEAVTNGVRQGLLMI